VVSAQTRSWFLFAATIIDLCCSCAVAIFFSYQASRALPAAIRSVLPHCALVFWISYSRSRHRSSIRELGRLSRRRFFPPLVGRSRPVESGSVHPVFSLPFCICVFLPDAACVYVLLFSSFRNITPGRVVISDPVPKLSSPCWLICP
jgi:hypothetical protein